MGIDAFYPEGSGPRLHGEALDDMLRAVPAPDIFDGAKDYGTKRPVKGLEQLLDSASETVRSISVKLNNFAFTGGIIAAVVEHHPERIAELSPEDQALAHEIAARMNRVSGLEQV